LIKNETIQDATFITSNPSYEKHFETRKLEQTGISEDATLTKKQKDLLRLQDPYFDR